MFHLTISKIYYYILKLFVFRWQHSKGEEVLVTEMKIVISTFAIINWVMIKKCESPSHCLEKSKFQHRKKSRWKLLLKIGGQSLLIFFVIWKTFKFFWRHFFFSFLKVFTTFEILLSFITHHVHQPLSFNMVFQTIAIPITVKKKKLVVKEMKVVVGTLLYN